MTEDEAKELDELLRDKTVACSACGTEMPENALICPKCGRFNASPIFAAQVSASSTGAFQPAVTETQVANESLYSVPGAVGSDHSVARSVENGPAPLDMGSLFATPMRPLAFGTPVEVVEPQTASPDEGDHAHEEQQDQPSRQEAGRSQGERQLRRIRFGSDTDVQDEESAEASLSPYLGRARSEQQPSWQYGRSQGGWQNEERYAYKVGIAKQFKYAAQPPNARQAFQRELFGYVGFLGVGHIYTGHVVLGVMLMIAWWVFLPWALITVLFNNGGGCLFLLVVLVPVISGLWASVSVDRQPVVEKVNDFIEEVILK